MTDLTLTELADRADVTTRTIRYYINQGLLPSPGTSGPGAHYDDGYLDRLRLIKKLQSAHLPLAEIRSRIESLSDGEVRDLLDLPETPAPTSARQYIRSVLAAGGALPTGTAPRRTIRESRVSDTPVHSTWERIALDPDLEIHVRRPLSRPKNEILSELLETARDLLKRGDPR